MPRQIVATFDPGADIHRVRNFNDSLLDIAREDDWMSFGLDQLDKATDQRVTVKSKRRVHQRWPRSKSLSRNMASPGSRAPR
ncbi:MAG TPA: hypothetical protein VG758_22065 [Hyphomicrobiaceae bacterium]|jgi:hypothetical protein|nr:hypothetical protein [Hyphomicrobiaceae bacterium]